MIIINKNRNFALRFVCVMSEVTNSCYNKAELSGMTYRLLLALHSAFWLTVVPTPSQRRKQERRRRNRHRREKRGVALSQLILFNH